MLFFSKIIHLKKSWKAMESCLLWKKSDPPPPFFWKILKAQNSPLPPPSPFTTPFPPIALYKGGASNYQKCV